MTKVVLTGGPCAGKTTAKEKIEEYFSQIGYLVLFLQETATELITAGFIPGRKVEVDKFQSGLIQLQIEKEKVFETMAFNGGEKILLVCDRGVLDSKAYMTEKEFQNIIDSLNCNEVELRDNYDAVFHLETAAKGAKEAYSLSNNVARTESIEEAVILDDKIISAWTGHPHFRVIDNSTDFETKILRLIQEISFFLGEPKPLEIERKFLIAMPDIKWLESQQNCQRIEILQTYLKSSNQDEIRVRQRGMEGHYLYYKTIKRNISGLKRIETERKISREEYIDALMQADTTRKPIRKTRYCLTYKNQYFEIDIYPFWNEQAIVEIEMLSENQKIHFPKELTIIQEVTEDPQFKNSFLAMRK